MDLDWPAHVKSLFLTSEIDKVLRKFLSMTTSDEHAPLFLSERTSAVRRRVGLIARAVDSAERKAETARRLGADEPPVSYLRSDLIDLKNGDTTKPGWAERVSVLESAISFYEKDTGLSRPSKGYGFTLTQGIDGPSFTPPAQS